MAGFPGHSAALGVDVTLLGLCAEGEGAGQGAALTTGQ